MLGRNEDMSRTQADNRIGGRRTSQQEFSPFPAQLRDLTVPNTVQNVLRHLARAPCTPRGIVIRRSGWEAPSLGRNDTVNKLPQESVFTGIAKGQPSRGPNILWDRAVKLRFPLVQSRMSDQPLATS